MESRPKIKLELTRFDKAVEVASLLLLILLWIGVMSYYSKLPDEIPTHFNASGDADGYGDKIMIVLIPVLAAIIYAALTFLNRYPHVYNYPTVVNAENAKRLYTSATRVIRVLKLAVIIIFAGIVLMTFRISNAGGTGLGTWFLPVAATLLILPVIVFVLKARPGRS